MITSDLMIASFIQGHAYSEGPRSRTTILKEALDTCALSIFYGQINKAHERSNDHHSMETQGHSSLLHSLT